MRWKPGGGEKQLRLVQVDAVVSKQQLKHTGCLTEEEVVEKVCSRPNRGGGGLTEEEVVEEEVVEKVCSRGGSGCHAVSICFRGSGGCHAVSISFRGSGGCDAVSV